MLKNAIKMVFVVMLSVSATYANFSDYAKAVSGDENDAVMKVIENTVIADLENFDGFKVVIEKYNKLYSDAIKTHFSKVIIKDYLSEFSKVYSSNKIVRDNTVNNIDVELNDRIAKLSYEVNKSEDEMPAELVGYFATVYETVETIVYSNANAFETVFDADELDEELENVVSFVVLYYLVGNTGDDKINANLGIGDYSSYVDIARTISDKLMNGENPSNITLDSSYYSMRKLIANSIRAHVSFDELNKQ